LDGAVELVGDLGWFKVELDCIGAHGPGFFDKHGRRVDASTGPNGHIHRGALESFLDDVHVVGGFAEPDDIRPKTAGVSAGWTVVDLDQLLFPLLPRWTA